MDKGTEDKMIFFIGVEHHNFQEEIPEEFYDIEGLGFLGGHTL